MFKSRIGVFPGRVVIAASPILLAVGFGAPLNPPAPAPSAAEGAWTKLSGKGCAGVRL
jgi:hypothetical protein